MKCNDKGSSVQYIKLSKVVRECKYKKDSDVKYKKWKILVDVYWLKIDNVGKISVL